MLGITAGMTNKEVGLAIGVSPRTVDFYRARLMEKLGLRSLASLVRLCAAAEWRNHYDAQQGLPGSRT